MELKEKLNELSSLLYSNDGSFNGMCEDSKFRNFYVRAILAF